MLYSLKPPVVTDAIEVDGAASAPALIWNGTGTASLFIQSSSEGSQVGVVFGADASMGNATATNSFPVPFTGIRWKLGPSTRYISVYPYAVFGTAIYYFEGQTDITT